MFRAIEIAEIAAIVFRSIGALTSRGVQATVTATDIWVQVSLSGFSEERERRETLNVDFFPGEGPEKAGFLEKVVRDLPDFDPYEYIEWAKGRYENSILTKNKQ